jgi:flagellar biosynthetic protein FlhB
VLAVVATADYLFQYAQWYERQKMSPREIKEEFRQTEGDPTIKGKLRQLRTTRMRKRIMAAVPKAPSSSPTRLTMPSRSNTSAA